MYLAQRKAEGGQDVVSNNDVNELPCLDMVSFGAELIPLLSVMQMKDRGENLTLDKQVRESLGRSFSAFSEANINKRMSRAVTGNDD